MGGDRPTTVTARVLVTLVHHRHRDTVLQVKLQSAVIDEWVDNSDQSLAP